MSDDYSADYWKRMHDEARAAWITEITALRADLDRLASMVETLEHRQKESDTASVNRAVELLDLYQDRDRLRVALEVIRDARRRNTGPTDLTRADMREIAHTALAQGRETGA